MSKAKNFLKNRMKEAPKRLGCYGASSAGTVAASLVTNNETVRKNLAPKWHGAILFGLGAVSAVLNPEDYSNSFLGGMGGYGSMLLTSQVTKRPDIYGIQPDAVGLKAKSDGKGYEMAGLGYKSTTAKEVDGTPDWAKMIQEANKAIEETGTQGLPEESMDATEMALNNVVMEEFDYNY